MTRLARNERLIHSLKTAIACCIGFLVTIFLGMPVDSWVVVSICVIMCGQVYVGDILQKSNLRFLGTILGCLFASAVIVTFGVSYASIVVTIAVAAFAFTYIATGPERFSYAGTLGIITTVIVITDKHPSLRVTGYRLAEISIGIVVAMIVSRFILPIRAADHIIRSQNATLSQLRRYYVNTVVTNSHAVASTEFYELDEEIGVAISLQRQTAKAAARGWFEPAFDRNAYLHSVYSEKELLRSINFMHIAMTEIRNFKGFEVAHSSITQFHETVLQSLDVLIARTAAKDPAGIPSPPLPGQYEVLKKDMLETAGSYPVNGGFHVEAFLFSAEILTKNIVTLLAFHER